MNYLKIHRKLKTTVFLTLILSLFHYRVGLADHHNQASVMTDDIEFFCEQAKDNSSIKCSYRLVIPEMTKQITASLGQLELPIKDISTYPYADSTTSILFLVDTSKTNNDDTFAQTREHIIALAQQALPHQQIGLASFDSRLNILKPLGSDPGEIVSATSQLIETEQPTELYGNILDAIKLLTTSQADRKALFLFSSGESEDQAIYQSDVIKAALDEKVKIVTINYPVQSGSVDNFDTTVSQTTKSPPQLKDQLKNLRSLSEQSGGMSIVSSNSNFELPEAFLSDPFAVIDNGGTLTIDLSSVKSEDLDGIQLSVLVIETQSKRITVKLPLNLVANNVEKPVLPAVEESAENTSVTSPPAPEQSQFNKNVTPERVVANKSNEEPALKSEKTASSGLSSSTIPLSWLLLPLALIIMAGSWLFLKTKKKHGKSSAASQQEKSEEEKTFACLVSLTDDSMYYSIESSPWTIGRTRQNDMFLEHSSVSRHHAEIKRNRDGSFTIVDLDSLNGVFVNNTKVSSGLVKENDKIDIGDLRLKFVFRTRDGTSEF